MSPMQSDADKETLDNPQLGLNPKLGPISPVQLTKSTASSNIHPDYVQTLQIKDSNGQIKELIFPKGLDLDRPKRARTTFTSDQLSRLEKDFKLNQYLVGRERALLATRLGLSETQVKVWYQNRRTKHKRDREREKEGFPSSHLYNFLHPSEPPHRTNVSALVLPLPPNDPTPSPFYPFPNLSVPLNGSSANPSMPEGKPQNVLLPKGGSKNGTNEERSLEKNLPFENSQPQTAREASTSKVFGSFQSVSSSYMTPSAFRHLISDPPLHPFFYINSSGFPENRV